MPTFEAQMKAFANMTEDKANKVFRKTCLTLTGDIMADTPADTGRARGNWIPDINTFPNYTSLDTDKSKTATASKSKAKMVTDRLVIGDTYTLTNNLDYIETLEYGLYPNPVKFGSPTDKAKDGSPVRYEVKSIGGFSLQAPNGMVRQNLLRFNHILQLANQEIR